MSDSDDAVTHPFDQTNGVIAAADGETDGALSGRTTADVDDPTGDRGARSTAAPSGADRSDDEATDSSAVADDGRAAGADPAPATGAGATATSTEDSTSRSEEVRAATLDVDRRDEPGEDFAPTADLPLPGTGDRDEEHSFAVGGDGTATETDGSDADEATYSGAPEVAALSAADDGRDEGATRSDSSTAPVQDSSHTGRLADAYAAGPADEVDDDSSDAASGTAAAYAAGPADSTAADRQERPAPAQDDDSVGHVFDQTNGVVDALDGESDGTAGSDTRSAGDADADR